MKILFISDTYYPHVNGVYYFVQRLACRLQMKGHAVAVIAPSQSMRYSKTYIDEVCVFGVPSFSILLYGSIRLPIPFLLKSRIGKIIETFQPDVIHIQGHFFLSKAAMEVNKRHGVPVVATNHFMTENFTAFIRSSKWQMMIEKWMWFGFAKVFNQALMVTTPTETGVRLIRSKLNVKVAAISNGIDLKNFNPLEKNGLIRKKYSIPEKPVLLYVGRLDPEKHLHEVLQAVALANENDFCFIITGKGVERPSLETLAKKLGIAEKVIFTGFVPDEELHYLYQLSQCFITASIAELQSIATMEAMASGLPVIAANAGALAELVHDGENGYLFSPGDIETLAKRINTIFGDGHLRNNMSVASLKYIAPHDIHNTVGQYELLYQNLLANKNIGQKQGVLSI